MQDYVSNERTVQHEDETKINHETGHISWPSLVSQGLPIHSSPSRTVFQGTGRRDVSGTPKSY